VKLRHHASHALRGLAVGAAVAAAVIGTALGVFVAAWGWARFRADFWPLDNSRVGPNLVASIVLTVLVIGHNEYRTTVRAVKAGETVRQLARDLEAEVLHPAETAEQHIADDVAQDGS
jgi:hypothetical protein